MPSVITAMLCVTLLVIAVQDLRTYRIANEAVLLTVVLFFAAWASGSGVDVAFHVLLAAVVLALMVGAFALGLIGGGDAKLLVAALLWVGPEGALLFAVLLLGLSLAYGAGAVSGLLPSRRVGGRTVIPFGPCIAGAWTATVLLPPAA